MDVCVYHKLLMFGNSVLYTFVANSFTQINYLRIYFKVALKNYKEIVLELNL